MALTNSEMVPLGIDAPDFDLFDTNGKSYSLRDFKDTDILVLIFMCNHCPYVKSTLARLVNLQNEYSNKNVQLIGINPNDSNRYPEDSPEAMKKVIAENNISFPYLIDSTQKTARAYNAVCTPDIFVYGRERTLLYRGRFDDNWKEPVLVERQDLKIAIDLILVGKDVFQNQIPSIGCSIKWKT